MTNREIAVIFREMATYLEMDDIDFRPRAYSSAADSLLDLHEEVSHIYEQRGLKGLDEIPAVGESIALHIEELLKTGHMRDYDRLKKKTPVDLASLGGIEGLGPKTIKTLYKKLGVSNRKDLEKAINKKQIRTLPHFGIKTEDRLKQSLSLYGGIQSRHLLSDGLYVARRIKKILEQTDGVVSVEIAGSIRRMKETVGDIDIVVATKKPAIAMKAFIEMGEVKAVVSHGRTRSSVRLVDGMDCDIRVVSPEVFGSAMIYFTGSRQHVVELRKIALKKNMTMNEYGLFEYKNGKKEKLISAKTEKEVYRRLGLDYIEPELREMTGELENARNHTLPHLMQYGSLRGDLQTQTNWTDGRDSIEQMAYAAQERGLSYIAITDHTRALTVTGGLDERALARHNREIDLVNSKIKGITVLKGAEVNILLDGNLDIKTEALMKLDVVGISVHSHFGISRSDMTARVIKAMQNPAVHILFHPTGRRILRRDEYDIDMDAVISAAKKYHVILEANAYPDRLDLRDEYIKKAVDAGVMLVINSDAHAIRDMDNLIYGIGQARRGWASEKDILNTRSVSQVKKILERNRLRKMHR